MPKIIFRPNPTPPPFVPPTPVPTENLVSISPYPFGDYDQITVVFSNIIIPTGYSFIDFDMHDSAIDAWATCKEWDDNTFELDTPFVVIPEVAFDNCDGYSILFGFTDAPYQRIVLNRI